MTKIKNYNEFVTDRNEIINETKFSRVLRHIKNDESFGIISPFRDGNTPEKNELLYVELKNEIRGLKYGFLELKGGFVENGVTVVEKSFLVPLIDRNDLIELGEKYEQFSVIYKDDDEFVEINTRNKVGRIESTYGKNISFNSDVIKEFFSSLAKGSHRNRKFIFPIAESFLYEVVTLSFNEICSRKKIGEDEQMIRLL